MITDSTKKYLESFITQDKSVFIEMEQLANEERIPIMESVSMEVLLQLLKIQQPQRILEIGTAIGYSAMRMANALPYTTIVTVEINKDRISQAETFINKDNLQDRITILEGDALTLINEIRNHGGFDAVFIDAAKGQYQKYFEVFAELLTDHGCIYTDNVLFRGLVADKERRDNKRLARIAEKLDHFNHWLMHHEHYDTVIIPVGDGIAVSKKKK